MIIHTLNFRDLQKKSRENSLFSYIQLRNLEFIYSNSQGIKLFRFITKIIFKNHCHHRRPNLHHHYHRYHHPNLHHYHHRHRYLPNPLLNRPLPLQISSFSYLYYSVKPPNSRFLKEDI